MEMGKKQGVPSENQSESKTVPSAPVASHAARSDSASHEQWRAARTVAGRPGAPEAPAPGLTTVASAPSTPQAAAARDEVLNGKRPDADAALVRDVMQCWRTDPKPESQDQVVAKDCKARVQR